MRAADLRRAERRADAGKPIVGLDADECRVALVLCSKVGVVAFFHRNGADIGIAEILVVSIDPFFPGQSIRARYQAALPVSTSPKSSQVLPVQRMS